MSNSKRLSPQQANRDSKKVRNQKGHSRAIEAREQLLLQAVLAFQARDYSLAERLSRRLIVQSSAFSPAKLLLGMVAGKTGRRSVGIDVLREAIAADPDYLELYVELAGLLNAEGQVAAAIELCEVALLRWPESAALYNMLGLALLSAGRATEAIGTFQRAAALDPGLTIVAYNVGMAFQAENRDEDAMAAYRTAIEHAPEFADAYSQLAHLLFAHGRRDEAREILLRGNTADPSSVAARLSLAELALGEGRIGDAESIVTDVIAKDSESAAAHHLLAIVQQQSGRLAEAHASYERAAELSPRRTGALLGLVMSKKLTEQDRPIVDRLNALLQAGTLAEASRADIHYALGKACDDLADYKEAMWHWDSANAIVADRVDRAGIAFEPGRHHADVDRMIESFSGSYFDKHRDAGIGNDLPIFIVGMPRSGTTLVEQIITSHPQVGAGGEQFFWPDRAALVGRMVAGAVPPEELRRLAEEYCTTLGALSPNRPRVTDKMPANFLMLAAIHLALPRARIVHCRRQPVDTCLSIYSTPFSNLVNFAHRRDDIVAYYRDYMRLMAHWRSALPADRLFEIDYERLVTDNEGITRELISFLGLDWNDECLRHHRNPNAIHTPSWWQARQPVYKTSVDRWRRYEPWLGSFADLLEEEDPPR